MCMHSSHASCKNGQVGARTSSTSSGNPVKSAPSSTNHTDLSAAKAFSKSQTSVLEDTFKYLLCYNIIGVDGVVLCYLCMHFRKE